MKLLSLLLLSTAAAANAATYYVDAQSGNDLWPGTAPSPVSGTTASSNGPWKTLARIGAASLQPGDAVLLKCGQTWREQLTLPVSSGTSAQPVTYGRYPSACGAKPLILGSDQLTAWSPYKGSIQVSNAVYSRPAESMIKNGSFGGGTRGWYLYSTDPTSQLAWKAACSPSGCLQLTSGPAGNALAIANTFSLTAGSHYQLTVRMSAAPATNPTLIVRRNGGSYDTLGLSKTVSVGTGWNTYSLEFVATETTDQARLDIDLPVGKTLYVDDVTLVPLTPAGEPVNQIFTGAQALNLAHHPNRGYLSGAPSSMYLKIAQDSPIVKNADGRDVSNALTAGADLTLTPEQQDLIGAGIKIRTTDWSINERIVSGYTAATKTFALDGNTDYAVKANWGYYLDNKLWMLDEANEWYHDTANGRLYVWPQSAADLSSAEIAHRQYGIYAAGASNIIIDGLAIRNAVIGINLDYAENFVVRNMDIVNSGNNGIYAKISWNGVIDHNWIDGSRREAVYAPESDNLTITANQITNSGVRLVGNQIVNNPLKISAAVRTGDHSKTRGNTIRNSGYNGIFYGLNSSVSGNVVENSCYILDDCGGLYTGRQNNNSVVTGNLVVNTYGNGDGRPNGSTAALSEGIYLDDQTTGVTVTGNTVVNTDHGIKLHNAALNTVSSNTAYGNRLSQLIAHAGTVKMYASGDVHGNQITDNLFFPTSASSFGVFQMTGIAGQNTVDFAGYDRNRYSVLYSPQMAKESWPGAETLYTLAKWQQAMDGSGASRKLDPNGTSFRPFVMAKYRLLAAPSSPNFLLNGNFESNTNGWTIWNDSNATVAASKTLVAGCPNGACLKFTASSSTTRSQLTSNNFKVEKDKSYLVHFDLRSDTGQQNIGVIVRRGGGSGAPPDEDYAQLGLSTNSVAGPAWHTYSFVFRANATVGPSYPVAGEKGARLDLTVNANQVIYIDNVVVQEVAADYALNPDNSRILLNGTDTAASQNCPDIDATRCAQYVTFPEASPVTWPLQVPAHGSRIVVWAANPMRDTDGDGVADSNDRCSQTPAGVPVDEYGCSFDQKHPSATTATVSTNSNGNVDLRVNLVPLPADIGKTANIYLAAYTSVGWFVKVGSEWQAFTMGASLPPFATRVLEAQQSIDVLTGEYSYSDLTGWGAQVFVAYATADSTQMVGAAAPVYSFSN